MGEAPVGRSTRAPAVERGQRPFLKGALGLPARTIRERAGVTGNRRAAHLCCKSPKRVVLLVADMASRLALDCACKLVLVIAETIDGRRIAATIAGGHQKVEGGPSESGSGEDH